MSYPVRKTVVPEWLWLAIHDHRSKRNRWPDSKPINKPARYRALAKRRAKKRGTSRR